MKRALIIFSLFLISNLVYPRGSNSMLDNNFNVLTKKIRHEISSSDTSSLERNPGKSYLSLEVLGPFYLSSLGYTLNLKIKERNFVQFDFRFMGHFQNYENWLIGNSFAQSYLYGKKHKFKIGVLEAIVLNPRSLNGDFDDLQSWDRPAKYFFLFSLNIGYQLNFFKSTFFLTPQFYLYTANRMKYSVDSSNVLINDKTSGMSFGIDLKFKL